MLSRSQVFQDKSFYYLASPAWEQRASLAIPGVDEGIVPASGQSRRVPLGEQRFACICFQDSASRATLVTCSKAWGLAGE